MSERNTGLSNSRRPSPGEDKRREETARSFFASVVCVVGIVLALGVVLYAILFGAIGVVNYGVGVVSGGAVGVLLGVLGYYLGASRLGTATIVISIVALFFGLAASQGLIPGFSETDRDLPEVEPASQRPSS